MEKITSKSQVDSDISHEVVTLVINEEQHYFRLKESIRAQDDHMGDIERDRLIDYSKRIGQNEK